MEVNLYEFFVNYKNKLIYFGFIVLIIYLVCIYSNNLLSRFLILNKIKSKINELNKVKEYENTYINNKLKQVNNINSKLIYQQNINDSLNSEYNEVKKNCDYIDKKYISDVNYLSSNVPNTIKNKLKAYITEINDAHNERIKNDERIAQLEYERNVKDLKRRQKIIQDAVDERNRRRNAIANERKNRQAKKEQLRKYIINSANKIPNCNTRKNYLIQMEKALVSKSIPKYQYNNAINAINNKYRNHCRSVSSFLCIKDDTLITLPDNKFKKIKDINIGDTILSFSGSNKVINIHKDFINQNINIYGINDIEPFFTDTHPIVSAIDKNIVFSIKPELTLLENPERKNLIKKLEIGDIIYINNEKIKVEKITNKILEKQCFVYDLILEDFNDYTYIANNILIESQEPKWFKYPQVTGVLGSVLIKYKFNEIDLNLINKINKNKYSLNDVIKLYNNIKNYKKEDYDAFLNNLNILWKNYYNLIK